MMLATAARKDATLWDVSKIASLHVPTHAMIPTIATFPPKENTILLFVLSRFSYHF